MLEKRDLLFGRDIPFREPFVDIGRSQEEDVEFVCGACEGEESSIDFESKRRATRKRVEKIREARLE